MPVSNNGHLIDCTVAPSSSNSLSRKPGETSQQWAARLKVWALLSATDERPDAEAGRIVCNISDNPAGAVYTCTVSIWTGPLAGHDAKMTGQAGGSGYEKFSAAFADALDRAGVPCPEVSGRGPAAVREFLEKHGYRVIEVL